MDDYLWVAQIVYVIVLFWCIACLYSGHRAGKINLWDCITTTKRIEGVLKTFTDPKKLAYIGSFVLMGVTFAYWGLINRLSEWYAGLFVSAWVLGKWLGDREQRLNKSESNAALEEKTREAKIP